MLRFGVGLTFLRPRLRGKLCEAKSRTIVSAETNEVCEFNVGVRLYASRSKNSMIPKPLAYDEFLIIKKAMKNFSLPLDIIK